jgi:DNA-binding NtrC family response regulator
LVEPEPEIAWPDRIRTTLSETGGRRQEAARRLGISRATLWRHMQAMKLAQPEMETFHETHASVS